MDRQNVIERKVLQKPKSRFAIRPYWEVDIPHLYKAADESRQHVGEWMSWMTDAYTLWHTKEWVRHAISAWENNEEYEFLIIDREDDSIAGACGLNEINWKDLVCNLGYWVRTSKLNLGAARQASQLLRDFGFCELGLNRLEIVIAVENEQSRRVAESLGAIYEGIQRQRLRVHETVHDARMYALLRNAG